MQPVDCVPGLESPHLRITALIIPCVTGLGGTACVTWDVGGRPDAGARAPVIVSPDLRGAGGRHRVGWLGRQQRREARRGEGASLLLVLAPPASPPPRAPAQ